jgi:hypothetical protein
MGPYNILYSDLDMDILEGKTYVTSGGLIKCLPKTRNIHVALSSAGSMSYANS